MRRQHGLVQAAIAIAIDRGQIAADCRLCGRNLRPFSWHGDDQLPALYVGRIDGSSERTSAAAWYSRSGTVRAVPAIDADRSDRYCWPDLLASTELARAVLAHLIGLDLPQAIWQAFEAEVTTPLTTSGDSEWRLDVDDILAWLEALQ